jgi:hypothetical protein
MATRISICRDGASFVQMELFLSYGVDKNKGGKVERQLWNRASISRISSPADRISFFILKLGTQHVWTQKCFKKNEKIKKNRTNHYPFDKHISY